MTTLIANATAAITAALQAAPAVAPQVARVRLRALGAATTTAVVVRPLAAEVAERTMSGPLKWVVRVAVECYAKTTTATAPDAAVDALVQATYARLMADATLGGAVKRVEPEAIAYDFDADGEQTACATLVFNITQFSTPNAI
jgi:hypothetical protein